MVRLTVCLPINLTEPNQNQNFEPKSLAKCVFEPTNNQPIKDNKPYYCQEVSMAYHMKSYQNQATVTAYKTCSINVGGSTPRYFTLT
ncbi:hypothetical protein MTR_8g062337 [Medicago truncatula]|uniref:Uncharacterized protein n=1 Tax=Medicago truncatula TaxID=3880 RepID=A0A072U2E3_MEDTR|nr:hypothetical protein MTR_8g062337 [Medicago truncatula]